jgi:hypothetical protein
MTQQRVFEQSSRNEPFDLDKVFLRARSKTSKTKVFCNSIPAIVGPWRGTIRAWHAPALASRGQRLRGEQPPSRATVPLVEPSALFMPREQTIPQLRSALRRERQLGIAGHPSYSVTRHHELRVALRAAVGRAAVGSSDTPPILAQEAKVEVARTVRARRRQRAVGLVLH